MGWCKIFSFHRGALREIIEKHWANTMNSFFKNDSCCIPSSNFLGSLVLLLIDLVCTPFLLNQTIHTLLCTDVGKGSSVPGNDMDGTQQYVEETSSSYPPYTSCGVRCSFPIADTKCNASTQTEDLDSKCFLEQATQVEEIALEEVVNVIVVLFEPLAVNFQIVSLIAILYNHLKTVKRPSMSSHLKNFFLLQMMRKIQQQKPTKLILRNLNI